MSDLDPCYCGDPLCASLWHSARMARRKLVTEGQGDPLVVLGHLVAMGISVAVWWKYPPPLWIGFPFAAVFWFRWHLLERRGRRGCA